MGKKPLREIQLIQLEQAKETKSMCAQNDIKYFLDFGTVLSAVRHKLFINWDDDLDVGMMCDES